MPDLPSEARVVVIGGGIVGCSVAYHLALRGVTDVVVLERKELTSGTTWHAAGLVGQLRATKNLTQLAKYTSELFHSLEQETGQATGFHQRGSVSVAANDERFEELKRGASMARLFGLDVETLSPGEVKELVPLAYVDDLVGGVHLPGDGVTNPVDTTRALAKGATARGAKIHEGVRVDRILTSRGRVTGVAYSTGDDVGEMRADAVVNAAGMWSRTIGMGVDATVPVHAAEHFYVVTEAVHGIAPNMPVLRDPDNWSYFKEEAGKLLVGWFEPTAKPWGMRKRDGSGGIPDSFAFDSLPADLEHIEPLLAAATARLPVLESLGIQLFFNGPESFTPDDRYLLGESPDLKGLYLACGFNSIGIQSSGGAGKALADWIIDGHPDRDLWDVDIRRMMPFQNNADYLRDRTTEALGLLYAMHWPFRQPETARGVRRSPLHDRLADRGACFGEVAGWERPNWFAPAGVEPSYVYSYGRQNWFPFSAEEHTAVREGVGLFDLSSFSKFAVEGADAEKVLNQICANDVSVPAGKIVYTQWLNDRGTIEADVTVTRQSDHQYLIVSAAATQVRDFAWLKAHIPESARCWVSDVTSSLAVLSVMGPRSRSLLSQVTEEDLSNEGFPFGTSRLVDLGYARVRASRITYVGELGWELYLPTEFAGDVFDRLQSAGGQYGLQVAGYHALNSLRMEKAYRHWGHDITPDDSPLQAGLGFAVSWEKPDGFFGKASLQRQAEEGISRRLVQFKLLESERLLHHNELIWRDDSIVGHITSGMYGHTVGGALGMGYVENKEGLADNKFINAGQYEIEVAGDRVRAEASIRPFYDPTSQRVRL
ncbi:MAG: FAD-dependent oxidoreductase [Actinomycetia bacterium]|nr:FAD-dependent oxidoreductase [Actinomycetes bacterium]